MGMDGLFIHYLTNELNSDLQNAKINRIFQPSSLDVILQIRAKIDGINQNVNLLLSSKLDAPRILISKENFQNPETPNNFCMLLRKYVERGIIKEIHQHNNDRIVEIIVSSFNEMEDESTYKIIIELMGRNSNIILVNSDNIIIDAIRKLPPSNESERTIIAHANYVYPASNKTINPFDIQETEDVLNAEGLSKKLQQILLNLKVEDVHTFLTQEIKPVSFTINGKKDFYAYPICDLNQCENVLFFDSLSSLLDSFYKSDSTINQVNTLEIEKEIKQILKKNFTLLDNLNNDLDKALKTLETEDYAILLQSNLYKIHKGDTSITLENYLKNNEPIAITLDPLLDPSANLKKMFFKIKKAKKALDQINKLIDEITFQNNYLEEILFQLSIADDNEVYQIKQELINNGTLKAKKKTIKKKSDIKFLTYHVDDVTIYVGKNNLQNDYLTNKFARNNDVWFHVKDMPGSHVIIKVPNNDGAFPLTEKLIRTSAMLAAYFSKGKNSSSVPVDYTLVKYIKKIPGVQGFHVTYTNQKTIYIDPDEEFIKNLK